MKIIHYIPSIDRTSGGTTAYMQLLANELGKLVELHIVSHVSNNPVNIGNCQVHYIPTFNQYRKMKRQWLFLLNEINPDIVHINCCWMPGCALTQKWSQELNYKIVLTPHGMLEPWIIKRHYWTRKIPALLLYQKNAIIKAITLPTIMKWRNQNEKNKKNHEHYSCRTHGAFSTCRVGRWCFGSNIVRFRGVL